MTERLGRMIGETMPDTVSVTTVDSRHHLYITRAMEQGVDEVTEQPTDVEKMRRIFDAIQRTGRSVRVAFQYRDAPRLHGRAPPDGGPATAGGSSGRLSRTSRTS
jgi:predicted dehydrogenase